jgi:hypothetical protein
MTTLHLAGTTTATPQELLAALTHFARGRADLFATSFDEFLTVHAWGDDFADVTEGNPSTWERLHYDWSDPIMVTATTTGSNVWGRASGYTYTFSSQSDGTTQVDVVVVREGKNPKGWLLAALLMVVGQRVLGRALDDTLLAIEARRRAPLAVAA